MEDIEPPFVDRARADGMARRAADLIEALEQRYEATAVRLWDARLRLMLLEADYGRSDPAVRDAWSIYQRLRDECSALLAAIDRLDHEE